MVSIYAFSLGCIALDGQKTQHVKIHTMMNVMNHLVMICGPQYVNKSINSATYVKHTNSVKPTNIQNL